MKYANIVSFEVFEMLNMISLFKILAETSSTEEQSIIIENLDDNIDIEMRWLQQRYEWMTDDDWMCPVMREVSIYKDDVLVFNKVSDGGLFSEDEIAQMSTFVTSLVEE